MSRQSYMHKTTILRTPQVQAMQRKRRVFRIHELHDDNGQVRTCALSLSAETSFVVC